MRTCAVDAVGAFLQDGLGRAYERVDDNYPRTYRNQNVIDVLHEESVLSRRVYDRRQDERLLIALIEESGPSARELADSGMPKEFGMEDSLVLLGEVFRDSREFNWSWAKFKFYVQHGYRFFDAGDGGDRAEMLTPIMKLFEGVSVVLDKDTELWRARIADRGYGTISLGGAEKEDWEQYAGSTALFGG